MTSVSSSQTRLSLIEVHRANCPPIPRGVAPCITSDMFRVIRSDKRPQAKITYSFSPLKAASSDLEHDKAIALGTARPHSALLPWNSLEFQACNASRALDRTAESAATSMYCTKNELGYDLSIAMNYSYSTGSPQLLRYFTEHIELVHDPQYRDWETCITCGTTSALEYAFRILCDPGDSILTEAFTYPGALAALRGQGLKVVGVQIDDYGLSAKDLELELRTWDTTRGPRPSVLYTIPTGQNPTGTTQTLERRQEIYAIAETYDLFIIEDDPYYFLQLDAYRTNETSERVPTAVMSSLDCYFMSLPKSYLSLDTCGRVLRLDSTSKILGPGLRLGWATSSPAVISKFLALTEVGVQAPNGPSQIMLYKLLDENWRHGGFLKWLADLSSVMRQRRDRLIQACKSLLAADTCTIHIPSAGMFVWVKVNTAMLSDGLSRDESKASLARFEEKVYVEAQGNGVLISKGSWFDASSLETSDVHFRLTYAAAPVDELTVGVQKFAKTLTKYIG
ncbi:aromatic aminotransferase Aro8 [Myriangium duriaei CBS 260.36]|uniref:Aromatic aminotransferase Aro8 n=1 Tax=Myriangium duriaei CBS 260.36 TaxID=1168546 RepID=A0A9P4IVQ2_9PEZI|nr:aromatic aminotransferase Aro8 [Myriangium duriaei CBS 260.36]